ncbi:NusG domain II-containing protein [Clostridium niameyense]|uniref:NusG domain II-containing protein n=1 Tax=Clostridium niameyense TaxID=1622073 RepID=A0A6M0RC58_9CLOT|nr:NusG domain II-containing protein [Clostridium niameyense]NEZ47179.1 NusG domain II-containing protein [Clostridium niameyense]
MKKGDKIASIIIAVILIASLSSIAFFKYGKSSKKEAIAVIKQDGKVIERIDLNKVKEKKKWNIYYKDKDYNTIILEPHRIRFIDADCHDKVCVKSGWLSKPGETAACLPHKLMIVIEGKDSKIDAVSY